MDAVLKVCNELKARIQAEEEKVKELREVLINLAPEIDGLPRSQQIDSKIHKITSVIIDSERLVEQLKEIRRECVFELNGYLRQKVPDVAIRKVLFGRYGFGKLFRDIGLSLGYSERRVYMLHAEGLKILQ